jgi:hypothetical protein
METWLSDDPHNVEMSWEEEKFGRQRHLN